MPTIRPSRPGEGERLLEIWRAAVDATHDFLSTEDRAAIEAEVAAFLPATPAWLAVDEADRPLGFMLLGEGRMEALFVDPAAHGRGVGRALVAHAAALHPGLETEVNAQNPAALGFYHRLGFAEIGRLERDGQGRPYPLIRLRLGPG